MTASPRTGPAVPGRPGLLRIDAVWVLTAYVVVLVLLPARLVVGPLGAVGTPAAVIGLLAALWWGSSRIVPHLGGAVGRQPVRVALGLFGTAMLAGYAAGMLRPLTPVEASGANRLMLAALGWVGVALLCADGISSRARLDALLRRVVFLGAILATIGIITFFTGLEIAKMIRVPGLVENFPIEDIHIRSGFRRVAGTTLHPIEFGVVLAMLLPLALHQALSRSKARDWLFLLLIAVALPMSLSRSATLGVMSGVLVLWMGWSGRRRANALLVGLIFLAVLKAAIPGLLAAIQDLFVNFEADPSTTTRTDDYGQVWGMITERPLFGRGTGTYVPEQYRILDNQFLLTTLEMGVVGVLALLGLFFTAMVCARGARRLGADPVTGDLGQALAASGTVALVSMVTFDAFSYPMLSGLLFLLFGCCGALWRLEVQDKAPHRLKLERRALAPAEPGRAVRDPAGRNRPRRPQHGVTRPAGKHR